MKKSKLVLGSIVAGAVTGAAAMYKATVDFTKNMLYRNEIERTNVNDLDVDVIRLKNSRGLVLYGYLRKHDNAQRTLVMCHRLGENAGSLKTAAQAFEKLLPETNILLLDAAAHGTSDGYIRGFGYKDADDLEEWNNYLIEQFGEDMKIIMYGEGMGANTILNASGLGKLKNVTAIVSNGAYDNVSGYLAYHIFKKYKVTPKLSPIVMKNIFKNEAGMDIADMDTVRLVKNNMVPTIFMHSKEDADVPFRDVFELYNSNGGKAVLFPIKELHFYDMNQDDDYSKILSDFLKDNA